MWLDSGIGLRYHFWYHVFGWMMEQIFLIWNISKWSILINLKYYLINIFIYLWVVDLVLLKKYICNCININEITNKTLIPYTMDETQLPTWVWKNSYIVGLRYESQNTFFLINQTPICAWTEENSYLIHEDFEPNNPLLRYCLGLLQTAATVFLLKNR